MDIKNEENRLNFEKKKATLFTTICGFSTLGAVLSGKEFIQNAFSENVTPENILKIAISGGVVILSTKILKVGLEGYQLSKSKQQEIEENIKTLKKSK